MAVKKTMKKLSLTRETIVDLEYFRISGGAATLKATCPTSGTTETTTSVDTTTVSTLGTTVCTQQ